MPTFVSNTALLQCSFGMSPSPLMILPNNQIMGSSGPLASIMDFKPFANILPFGMCSSASNPMVAAATAANLGIPTSVPCIPVTVAPWIVGSPTVQTKTSSALNNTSQCMCIWGGVIMPITPGQMTIQIP